MNDNEAKHEALTSPSVGNWYYEWQAKMNAMFLRKRNSAQRKLNKIGRKEGFVVEVTKVTFQQGISIGHELLTALANATAASPQEADPVFKALSHDMEHVARGGLG